eukprot:GHRQ01035412.1.p1 GENE.GHRQ01035412.1~~GHRQ01035412.1.p1  ORF type:complete len:166 (+),score=11.49 GHRQ01035412.1:113-610(+)
MKHSPVASQSTLSDACLGFGWEPWRSCKLRRGGGREEGLHSHRLAHAMFMCILMPARLLVSENDTLLLVHSAVAAAVLQPAGTRATWPPLAALQCTNTVHASHWHSSGKSLQPRCWRLCALLPLAVRPPCCPSQRLHLLPASGGRCLRAPYVWRCRDASDWDQSS